jgi:hypothetical protein
MDTVWKDRAQAEQWGEAAWAHYDDLGKSWGKVVRRLLA